MAHGFKMEVRRFTDGSSVLVECEVGVEDDTKAFQCWRNCNVGASNADGLVILKDSGSSWSTEENYFRLGGIKAETVG
jgi:hypothetical protein